MLSQEYFYLGGGSYNEKFAYIEEFERREIGLMILKKQLIMNIGKTENDLIITETMVKDSLNSFVNKPIVQFANPLGNSKIIGYIQGNIYIENNDVYADIFLIDSCKDEWKGKYDNWGITLDDDKESFQLDFIEVF